MIDLVSNPEMDKLEKGLCPVSTQRSASANTFVHSQVKEGRYSNASDVLRAALRLLEEQEAKLTALRAALVEGDVRPVYGV
jgi:putative addiction module CopG family antidote